VAKRRAVGVKVAAGGAIKVAHSRGTSRNTNAARIANAPSSTISISRHWRVCARVPRGGAGAAASSVRPTGVEVTASVGGRGVGSAGARAVDGVGCTKSQLLSPMCR